MLSLLHIEDDKVDRLAMKKALSATGFDAQLIAAHDGMEGLDYLRSKLATSVGHCVIIVLDLNLPRMNGMEFLQELRRDKSLRNSIVFVLTTSKDAQDIKTAYGYNIAGYVQKGGSCDGYKAMAILVKQYCDLVRLPYCEEPV